MSPDFDSPGGGLVVIEPPAFEGGTAIECLLSGLALTLPGSLSFEGSLSKWKEPRSRFGLLSSGFCIDNLPKGNDPKLV